MPRPAKRQKLEDESIDSDELSSTNVSDAEDEPEPAIISAEEKRLLMAQEYMEKIGIKYDGANDLENVSKALGLETPAEAAELKTIKIADEVSFEIVGRISAKKHRATCVEISFDDRFAYSGGKDGRLAVWDLQTHKRIDFFKGGHDGAITSICLALCGKLLASVGKDRTLKLWDTTSLELINSFQDNKHAVNTVGSAGDMLYTAGDDKCLRQYSLLHKCCLKAFYGHGERITSLDCLTSEHVLTAGDDKTARFWNIKFDKHGQYNAISDIESCAVLNRHGFLTGDTAGKLHLWSIARKRAVRTESTLNEGSKIAACSAIALLPNSDVAFSGNEIGTIQCWKACMADGGVLEKKCEAIETGGVVNALKASRSGRYIVAATAVESRLGRWVTTKAKDVGLVVIELKHSRIGHLYKDGDHIK